MPRQEIGVLKRSPLSFFSPLHSTGSLSSANVTTGERKAAKTGTATKSGSGRKTDEDRPLTAGDGFSRFSDYILMICAVLISILGIVSIYITVNVSNLSDCTGISKVIVQLSAVVLGIVAMVVISRIPFRIIGKYIWWLSLIVSVVILVITLAIGTGPNGTRSWIKIDGMPFSIQTSEFVKLLFIVSISGHLKMLGDRINHPLAVLSILAHTGIICGLVILQGDLGSAIVFVFIALAICFVSGMSMAYYLGGLAVLAAAVPFVWQFLSEYQRQRILVGFSPELDPLKYGYQVILSKDAVINGSITGSPFMELEYSAILPAAHSDMIFAVYSEQFGLVGAVILFLLYLVMVILLLWTARRCNPVGRTVSVGFAALIIFQTVENVGMCLGMLPVIGIPLPFMSYGGSSVLSLFCGLGIVLYMRRMTDANGKKRYC